MKFPLFKSVIFYLAYFTASFILFMYKTWLWQAFCPIVAISCFSSVVFITQPWWLYIVSFTLSFVLITTFIPLKFLDLYDEEKESWLYRYLEMPDLWNRLSLCPIIVDTLKDRLCTVLLWYGRGLYIGGGFIFLASFLFLFGQLFQLLYRYLYRYYQEYQNRVFRETHKAELEEVAQREANIADLELKLEKVKAECAALEKQLEI